MKTHYDTFDAPDKYLSLQSYNLLSYSDCKASVCNCLPFYFATLVQLYLALADVWT